jgi:thiazole synthase ThiGH ThiG subunit
VFCIFNEKEGEFYNLIIKGDNAREAPCGESWFNAIAALLTYALRRSMWEGNAQKAIVSHLKNHRCTKIIPNEEHIVSCSDAIGRMVLEYLKARGVEDASTS